MQRIIVDGEAKQDRTGTGRLSVFGHQMRFDLRGGFPLVTTRELHVKAFIHELLWFLAGDTNFALEGYDPYPLLSMPVLGGAS